MPDHKTETTPSPLRVVHILYSLETGGLERVVATLVSRASPDFDHRILCLSRSGPTERLLPPGTEVITLGKPPGNSIPFLWKLGRVLKRLRPEVVNTYNWAGMDGIVAARLSRLRAVVQNEHGFDMEDPFGGNRKRRFVRRFLSSFVHSFACVSQRLRTWLEEEVRVRRPVFQIYNGVDTERFRPGDGSPLRAELGLSREAFVIGVVARLVPVKNLPLLLQAVERLHPTGPETVLLVVGDGPERTRLEARAGAGVRFLGEREDVPDLLRSLDLFVLPSLSEGISLTLLEGMASGLPVVTTRVGGNPEIVEEGITGTLVPSEDAAALAAAMAAYRENPGLRRRHGEAGRRRVLERFSLAGMVDAYESLYRAAARGETPPPITARSPR